MLFKAFLKTQIFTETGCTNFDSSLPSKDGRNKKKVNIFKGKNLTTRLSKLVGLKALFPFNFQ